MKMYFAQKCKVIFSQKFGQKNMAEAQNLGQAKLKWLLLSINSAELASYQNDRPSFYFLMHFPFFCELSCRFLDLLTDLESSLVRKKSIQRNSRTVKYKVLHTFLLFRVGTASPEVFICYLQYLCIFFYKHMQKLCEK